MNKQSIENWPFDQARNCATLTMRQVLEGAESILLVAHEADDHSWQFIGTTDASVADGKLVCLEEMVHLDPTVLEVADLPPGWELFVSRSAVNGHDDSKSAIQMMRLSQIECCERSLTLCGASHPLR